MSRRAVAPLLLLAAAALSVAAVFVVHGVESRGGPLAEPWATPFLSPNGDGVQDEARISFRARRAQDVSVDVAGAGGQLVRRLLEQERVEGATELEWDGRDEHGAVVADGEYRIRITREGDRRAYEPARPVTVDTRPPIARLDSATLEHGRLRGLVLLEPGATVVVEDAAGVALDDLRAFRPRDPDAASAQPRGRRPDGTVAVRFLAEVGDRPARELRIHARDRAGNRVDLLAGADAASIRVVEP